MSKVYDHVKNAPSQAKVNRQRVISTLVAQLPGVSIHDWKVHPRYEAILDVCHQGIYQLPGTAETGLDNMVQEGVRIFKDTCKAYKDRNSVDLAIAFYEAGAVTHEEFITAIARKA